MTEAKTQPRKIGAGQFVSTLFTGAGIQFLTLLQGAILARWLGPDGRGALAAAILWPSFFAGVGIMGTGLVLARKAAKEGCTRELSHTAVLVALITGSLTSLVTILALPWLLADSDETARRAAWWFLPFILFNHLVMLHTALDHGSGNFARLNIVRMMVNPVYLLAIGILVVLGSRDVTLFVGALALSTVFVATWRLAQHIKDHGLFGPSLPLGPVFKESWPYALVGLLGMLFTTVDRALLLHLVNQEELGYYMIAISAASAASSITSAAGTVSFGISAQAELKKGFQSLSRIFRLSFCLWIFCGIGLAAVMPFLLPLIFGQEFDKAVGAALVLIPAAAMAGQAGLLEESMRAQGVAFVGVGERGVCLVVLLVAGWVMVPRWGLVGMAGASVLSQALLLLLLAWAIRGHFQDARLLKLLPGWGDVTEAFSRAWSAGRKLRGNERSKA